MGKYSPYAVEGGFASTRMGGKFVCVYVCVGGLQESRDEMAAD